jgi:SAM-dependent methyltransferase
MRFLLAAILALAGCATRCPEPSPPVPAPAAADPHAGGHHGRHGGHGPLVHRFESAAEWAAALEGPERDAWQRPAEVVKAMALADGMVVADLGAGTGYFLPYLSRAVGATGRVLALDIEADMVRWMRDRIQREGLGNVEPRIVLGDDPLLPDASVDRILVVDTWHHIPDRAAYSRRLARALRPGGSVWVVDFQLASSHGPPKEHKIAPDVTAEELRSAGLTVRVDDATLPEQYIVVGSR